MKNETIFNDCHDLAVKIDQQNSKIIKTMTPLQEALDILCSDFRNQIKKNLCALLDDKDKTFSDLECHQHDKEKVLDVIVSRFFIKKEENTFVSCVVESLNIALEKSVLHKKGFNLDSEPGRDEIKYIAESICKGIGLKGVRCDFFKTNNKDFFSLRFNKTTFYIKKA